MRRACLLLSPLLLSCGEAVNDTGFACLVPENLICDCDFDEENVEDPCGGGPLFDGDCSGDFVVGREHEVRVWLGGGTGDSWDIRCDAEITAANELSITAGFVWKPDGDADIPPDIITSCRTPPLAAGVWTVRYGDGVEELTVGQNGRGPLCVESGRQR